jgi:hypothetical protein
MSRQSVDFILRPGPEHWELWKVSGSECVGPEPASTPQDVGSSRHLLLALPTRSILSAPLWISSEGNATELAELELSSRHLLRKGAETYSIPVLKKDGRALVLALASSDDSEALEFFKKAKSMEFAARLLPTHDDDIVVWKELKSLCFAFYRENQCVFFASSGETLPGPAFCSILNRTALRLHAEGVISRMPAKLRILGAFTNEECTALGHALRIDWHLQDTLPAPEIPTDPSNPAPPTARIQIEQRKQFRKVALVALGVAMIYCLLIIAAGADYFFRKIQYSQLASELASMSNAAATAQNRVTSWSALRNTVDPQTFAIDQLDAVASQIPGEQVRLTQYNYDKGRLVITGEAADVNQAYEFFEKVKKFPMLQDYDWKSAQPQLAGRDKVRFEMEGVRTDAKTGEE